LANEGEGKVLTKANQLNAYLDASNYQYEDGIVTIGEEYSPGENSIWTRNAILADFKTNNTLNQYDNKEQVLNAFDRVFADKSKYSEETINQARQVISNLYDAKGDTSWEDLQSKADEYNTVSKQIRLDDKVDDLKWEEKPEDSAK
jgi:exonuclease VII small subunit